MSRLILHRRTADPSFYPAEVERVQIPQDQRKPVLLSLGATALTFVERLYMVFDQRSNAQWYCSALHLLANCEVIVSAVGYRRHKMCYNYEQ